MAMVAVAEHSHPAVEMETLLIAPAAGTSCPGCNMHKNCLQEFTQSSGIPLPAYSTINEGTPHLPMFRSIVFVDGLQLTSPNTFRHRKDAEQDVAKLALESLHMKFKNEGSICIHKDPVFCKSILNEYGVKQKIDRASYTTTQEQGLLPMFITTVTFDGKAYIGYAGKNKKEAEQNAACTAIDSILENSNTSSAMAQIIKSKGRLYAAVNKFVNTGQSTLKSQAENDVGTTGNFLTGSASWVPYPYLEIARSNQVNTDIPKKRKKRSKKKRKDDQTKRPRSDD